jgi:class 3 adenylate cyclase
VAYAEPLITQQKPPVDYARPQSYTPKFLADKILTTRSSIEGERKLVTVLFADVANYTAMAEKLFREIMMYYWLNKTQEVLESFQT